MVLSLLCPVLLCGNGGQGHAQGDFKQHLLLLFDLKHSSTVLYRLLGGDRSWGENGSLQKGSCHRVLPRTTATTIFVTAVSHSSLGCSPRTANKVVLGFVFHGEEELLTSFHITGEW